MVFRRAIAFDIGDKRIGVAVSDPLNEYAIPAETYFRTRSFGADVAAIARIARERGAGIIVCGMPVNFDGSESVQTEKTRRFIEALERATDLPVELEDERFTTMQSYILEGYLARTKKRVSKLLEQPSEDGDNE